MPCADVAEAVDDMMGLVNGVWTGTTITTTLGFAALLFDDVPGTRTRSESMNGVQPWGEAFIRHASGGQAALAADGSARSRWDRRGILTVVFRAPMGGGRTITDTAAQALLDGIEGVHTEHGVWFRNVRLTEQGRDGNWYKAVLLADFEYDQVK